jgi:hypothetical protein
VRYQGRRFPVKGLSCEAEKWTILNFPHAKVIVSAQIDVLTFGSDRAKPLLFQDLFAREGCYLALEPHFPYRNGRYKAPPALEEYTSRPPLKPRDVALKPNSFFTGSTNPSLPTAIDSDQRSSRRAVSPLDPASTHSRCAF